MTCRPRLEDLDDERGPEGLGDSSFVRPDDAPRRDGSTALPLSHADARPPS